MLLSELREYLKTKIECPQWCLNSLYANKDETICIYGIQGPKGNIAIGGIDNTSYTTKAISILVHWGKSPDKAEQKAQEVYNSLFGQEAVIGNKRVIKFDMRTSEPVSVGTDSNGIYEYVIETVIYYER